MFTGRAQEVTVARLPRPPTGTTGRRRSGSSGAPHPTTPTRPRTESILVSINGDDERKQYYLGIEITVAYI